MGGLALLPQDKAVTMSQIMMLFLGLVAFTAACAEPRYIDATVISVAPQYVTQREQVEVCDQVVARYRQPTRNGSGAGAGAIMGGMFGALSAKG